MSKYEAIVESVFLDGNLAWESFHVVVKNGNMSYGPEKGREELSDKLNAIFRAHEEREKREESCDYHMLPYSIQIQKGARFCPFCGKDMRGEA